MSDKESAGPKTVHSSNPRSEHGGFMGLQQGVVMMQAPTTQQAGLMRRAAGEKGREVDCGGEVFTHGGLHYGPGIVQIEDPQAADDVEAAADRLFNRANLKAAAKAGEEARKAVLGGDSSQSYLVPGNLPDGSTTGVVAPGPGSPHPVLAEGAIIRGSIGPVRRPGESMEQATQRMEKTIEETEERNKAASKAADKRETRGGTDPAVEQQREREEAQRKAREAEEKERAAAASRNRR